MKFLVLALVLMVSQVSLASGQGVCSDNQLKKGCREARKNCHTEVRPGIPTCHKMGDSIECNDGPDRIDTVCDYYCACGNKALEDGKMIEKIIKIWNTEDQNLLGK